MERFVEETRDESTAYPSGVRMAPQISTFGVER